MVWLLKFGLKICEAFLNIMDMKEQGRRTVSSKNYMEEIFGGDQIKGQLFRHDWRLTGRWDQGRR